MMEQLAPVTVSEVIREWWSAPLRNTIRRWNWKAAVWSGIYRAPAFFGASLEAGLSRALVAGAAEFGFRMLVSGVCGALTQALRHARPRGAAALILLVGIPAVTQLLEWLMHVLLQTPNVKTAVWISLAMTVLSSSFNWYSMRQGVLLSGGEGGTFLHDLRRMPGIIAGFIAAPFGWVFRSRASK
jgi:hypothetical protein